MKPLVPRTSNFFGEKPLVCSKLGSIFNYYNSSAKSTPDGVGFMTFNGLRLYYITGSVEPYLLAVSDLNMLSGISKKYHWVYLDNLKELMLNAAEELVRSENIVINSDELLLLVNEDRASSKHKAEILWLDVLECLAAKYR